MLKELAMKIGQSYAEKFGFRENVEEQTRTQAAAESADTESLGGIMGSVIGGALGSAFGPLGASVGAAVGGAGGNLVGKTIKESGEVPKGPSATIDSGSSPTATGYDMSPAAVSVAQSMQRMAIRGFQQKPVVDGKGKTF